MDNVLKSTEQNSSQEGLDVSPISDTKWVTKFESETKYMKIGLWTQGRPTQREWIIADDRLNIGFRWTSLEHMNDTTNDLVELTQRWHREWPCRKLNKRPMDFPNRLQMMNRGCHVQEWHLLPINMKMKIYPFPKFPPTIYGEYLFIFTWAWGG